MMYVFIPFATRHLNKEYSVKQGQLQQKVNCISFKNVESLTIILFYVVLFSFFS
jgi:hypothetical protein